MSAPNKMQLTFIVDAPLRPSSFMSLVNVLNPATPTASVSSGSISGWTPINTAAQAAVSVVLPQQAMPIMTVARPQQMASVAVINPATAAPRAQTGPIVLQNGLTLAPGVLSVPTNEDGPLKKYDAATALEVLGLQQSIVHRVVAGGKMPQPALRGTTMSTASTASILYIILAMAGTVDLGTLTRVYDLYVPGQKVKGQTIRRALTENGCFYTHNGGWRLGNIGEAPQPKNPGGVKRKNDSEEEVNPHASKAQKPDAANNEAAVNTEP